MKKTLSLFTAFLFIVLSTAAACATTYSVTDLDALFDTEGDGIIHFGDQTITSFSDPSCDYPNATSVTRTFMLNDPFDVSGWFKIHVEHYQSSLELGYSNYFLLNGSVTLSLVDSSSGWVTQTLSTNNTDLVYGINTVMCFIDSSGTNQDDFEITNFWLSYENTGCNEVPEPATLFLMGSCLIGLAGLRKRL